MDDVVAVPVLKGVILNRESDKSLMLEGETVGGFIKVLKRDGVPMVEERRAANDVLSGVDVVKNNNLGTKGGRSEANMGVSSPHLQGAAQQG